MVTCEHLIGERQREVITQNKSVTSNLKLSKIESVTSKRKEGSINMQFVKTQIQMSDRGITSGTRISL